jgi:hypothetical protein
VPKSSIAKRTPRSLSARRIDAAPASMIALSVISTTSDSGASPWSSSAQRTWLTKSLC